MKLCQPLEQVGEGERGCWEKAAWAPSELARLALFWLPTPHARAGSGSVPVTLLRVRGDRVQGSYDGCLPREDGPRQDLAPGWPGWAEACGELARNLGWLSPCERVRVGRLA